jgi:hypothetical protein
MRLRIVAVFLFAVLLVASSQAQTVKPVDPFASFPKGTTFWANERGSTIRLDNAGNGQVSGKFTTAVGCGKGVARTLVGAYNGNSVGFVVQFGKDCPSTASWNGTVSLGTPNRLKTLWFLTSGGMPTFASTNAGFDQFTQITLAAAPAELK